MPETIPADIAAAIDIFHLAARKQGWFGTGTKASDEAEKAATDARRRLERVISSSPRGYAEMRTALEAIEAGR